MGLYGRSNVINGLQHNRSREWDPEDQETVLEQEIALEDAESISRMGLWSKDAYPEKAGVPECAYYMRTGFCGYGAKCRYNHPRDRASAGGSVSLGLGEYPERVGEPECQYYLRTGTCKFGASCKFHHPRSAGGSLINVPLNIYGYPLRLGEKECSYYLKTGQCKFGNTCKFHHPQPAGMSIPATARPFYPTVQSPSATPEHYAGASTSYRVSRPPLLPGPYVPGSYGAVLLHAGAVPIPNWGPYTGPLTPAFSPGAPGSVGATSVYGVSQLNSSEPAFAGNYPLLSSSSPSGSNQKEQQFPERPGQPECQYYLRNGDCKFGSSCKFHHPPKWVITKTYTALSPVGLPLRPGEQSCTFYLQKGHCKFGRNCKFDHPMGTVQDSPSASSVTDIPVAPYMMLSSSSAMLPTVAFPEGQAQLISRPKVGLHITRDWAYGYNLGGSVGLTYSGPSPFWHSGVQQSSQGSSPNTSRSTRQDGEVHGY